MNLSSKVQAGRAQEADTHQQQESGQYFCCSRGRLLLAFVLLPLDVCLRAVIAE